MAIDPIFDTNALVHVVRNLKLPSQFLLDTFFPNVVEFDTEFVSIDVDVGSLFIVTQHLAVRSPPINGDGWFIG